MASTTEEKAPNDVKTEAEEGDREVIPGSLLIKADGRVIRSSTARVPPSPNFIDGVSSKDVAIDPRTGVWARVFVPEIVITDPTGKRPVVVYFHGGGFCMGDAGGESPSGQCQRLCKTSQVVVVSAGYRLAPEHRLPTAYDDAYTALLWLQQQSLHQASGEAIGEQWLINHADFSQVFLMGQSAGGNIVHHLVVLKPIEVLKPLSFKGLILVVPFFSGEAQSDSEKRYADDLVLSPEKHHNLWRFSLPLGASRDHPYCNVFTPNAPNLANVQFPRVLMVVGEKDPLHTRQLEYYNVLKEAGKEIGLVEVPGASHNLRALPEFEAENQKIDKTMNNFIQKSNA